VDEIDVEIEETGETSVGVGAIDPGHLLSMGRLRAEASNVRVNGASTRTGRETARPRAILSPTIWNYDY
jgi:hypothetical protein